MLFNEVFHCETDRAENQIEIKKNKLEIIAVR